MSANPTVKFLCNPAKRRSMKGSERGSQQEQERVKLSSYPIVTPYPDITPIQFKESDQCPEMMHVAPLGTPDINPGNTATPDRSSARSLASPIQMSQPVAKEGPQAEDSAGLERAQHQRDMNLKSNQQYMVIQEKQPINPSLFNLKFEDLQATPTNKVKLSPHTMVRRSGNQTKELKALSREGTAPRPPNQLEKPIKLKSKIKVNFKDKPSDKLNALLQQQQIQSRPRHQNKVSIINLQEVSKSQLNNMAGGQNLLAGGSSVDTRLES